MWVCTYVFYRIPIAEPCYIRYENATFAQPCSVENTTYILLDLAGEQFMTSIIKDNCRTPEFFCDPATMLCEHTKAAGLPCLTDGDCKTVSRDFFEWSETQTH